MKEPKRIDYPAGSAGDAAYKADMVKYKQWLKENTNTDADLDLLPIRIAGLPADRSPSKEEAKGWFKYVGPFSAKGSEGRKYYDSIVAILKSAGIDERDWQNAWEDAVDYTQTYGNDSNGDPRRYFNNWRPSQYNPKAARQFGTTKSEQSTITQYSPSGAAGDINKVIEQEVGRTATQAEVDAYTAQVNAAAMKEPAVYTSTTTTAPGAGGVISTSKSTAVSRTGFDPTIFAQNFARSRPDFAESFATKNFLQLVERLLKDPNAIGNVVE